ncbi:MAG: CRISPR-associated protein Csx20 [Raineya sp.]|nr:CRISPR-associated protein Csx20 [Raineya sp.]
MPNLFLLFSHRLTALQEQEARENWGVEEIIYLPADLQGIWSNFPAEQESIRGHVERVVVFLEEWAREGDLVLVQGDFGATVLVVQWCWQRGIKPIYSTTQRIAREVVEGEQVRVERIFEHCRFRLYEKW